MFKWFNFVYTRNNQQLLIKYFECFNSSILIYLKYLWTLNLVIKLHTTDWPLSRKYYYLTSLNKKQMNSTDDLCSFVAITNPLVRFLTYEHFQHSQWNGDVQVWRSMETPAMTDDKKHWHCSKL